MKNIALIAESPNDAGSVKNLLLQKYPGIQFTHIAKNRKGSQLDSNKTVIEIRAEVATGRYNHYIFIRDLDDLETNRTQSKIKHDWFKRLDSLTRNKGIFLLNIYELEALILSDVKGFNKFFRINEKFAQDPMKVKEPKEFLKKKTKNRYKESDCPEIFSQLDIAVISKNCRYFKAFLAEFDARVKKAA